MIPIIHSPNDFARARFQRRFRFALTLIAACLLAACANAPATQTLTSPDSTQAPAGVLPTEIVGTSDLPDPTQTDTAVPAGTRTFQVGDLPVQDATLTPNPALPSPADNAPAELVDLAKEELAERLKISVDQIELVDFESVTWPDGSLGCPDPNRAYIQIQVEGYRIRLRYGETIYNYHGSPARSPFLCKLDP